MVWEELVESLIFTEVDAKDANEVFEKVGSAFVQEGYCKPEYVEALKTREASYPTGLDVDGFGVAIPHTDASYVNETKTGIAILKNPVTFTQLGTDDEYTDVKLIFMLAVQDPSTHLDKLQAIISMIQDKEFLKTLSGATTKAEMINIVKEKELSL